MTPAPAVAAKNSKNAMENKIKIAKYRHYKGKEYKVIGIANHSETLEKLVIYQALYGKKELWVRPLKMFTEQIEVDGKIRPRFEYIRD
jgi:hypothetical protein